MDRFIARENIKHFRDRLWPEVDQEARSLLRKLLVEEEDKLGADLELLADIKRHIADGNQRIERQRALVTVLERDGQKGLAHAKTLLDGMLESQVLLHDYHRRIVIQVSQSRL